MEGLTRLHELEELLGLDLDEVTRATVATVGGLIMTKLDRIPRVGDEVTILGHRLRVERLDGRRVSLVSARRVPQERREPISEDPEA